MFTTMYHSSERRRRSLVGMRLLVALLGASLLAGCEYDRKSTYPRDFIYLDKKQVRGEMALMWKYMRQIDTILADGSTISSEQQRQLVGIINSIDEVTNRLGAGAVQTSHLVIDDHIDEFKADVNAALRDARADPPNYFALGKLAGSCAGCHRYRKN